MATKIYKRVFLNPVAQEGIAAAQLRFQKVKETEYEASLIISDCNRQVTLDFDFWTPKMRQSRLKKVDALIGMLSELREEINSANLKKF